MNIAVTGSIATDHLMTFVGKFSDSLVVDQLDKISLSFLAEDLQIRRGGIGANICFGMANLGLSPVLVGAVGEDFADYRSWLERHGVDCASIHALQVRYTARFVCTTDESHVQIATFYAGAMSEARDIELRPVSDRVGGLDLVVISPNDLEAMLRHTEGVPYPGLPLRGRPVLATRLDGRPSIRLLVEGAAYLFSNQYEAALVEKKTGWSPMSARPGRHQVTTLRPAWCPHRAGRPGRAFTCPSRRRRTPSTPPASATRSGPAFSQESPGSSRSSGRPRWAPSSRPTSSRL